MPFAVRIWRVEPLALWVDTSGSMSQKQLGGIGDRLPVMHLQRMSFCPDIFCDAKATDAGYLAPGRDCREGKSDWPWGNDFAARVLIAWKKQKTFSNRSNSDHYRWNDRT